MCCRKCGCGLTEGAKFCGKCGERIVLIQPSPADDSIDQSEEKSIIEIMTDMVPVLEDKKAVLINDKLVIKVKPKSPLS